MIREGSLLHSFIHSTVGILTLKFILKSKNIYAMLSLVMMG
jgi:hypothetical protein